MEDSEKNKKIDRRNFINSGVRLGVAIGIGGLGGALATKSLKEDYVWQLDPAKCIQCGRCADECVLTPSAVKCVHVYDMCGYCDLCRWLYVSIFEFRFWKALLLCS